MAQVCTCMSFLEFKTLISNLCQGPTFDVTATRAATGVQIRNAASPNICFDVSNFRAGDFRFNLVPIALKECDSSIAGQKFDLITKVCDAACQTSILLTKYTILNTGKAQ